MDAAAPYLFAEKASWTIAFWASFFAFFLASSWTHRRERTGPRGDVRDRGSHTVIVVCSAVGAASAFTAPFWMPQARIELPHDPVFLTAMAVFWAGVLLYLWSVLTLGRFFRTTVQLLDGQRLVTKGPYRLLRHPAYTGGILLYAGIGLAVGNWVSAGTAPLAVALGYVWRIHVEEAALRDKFGTEFEERRRRTWAVIPFLW